MGPRGFVQDGLQRTARVATKNQRATADSPTERIALPLSQLDERIVQLPSWFWPAILIASAVLINVLVLAGVQTPLRFVLALWFLLVCPGLALVRLLRIRSFALELPLAMALSIALASLVAGSLLYAGLWSSEATLIILGAITIAGAVAQLRWPPEIGVETGDNYDNNRVQHN